MLRYKTVLLMILTLCSAALMCQPLSTDTVLKQHFDTTPKNAVNLQAGDSSDILLDLTAELTYSTYFGGSGNEGTIHIVTDSKGDVWVSGDTNSDNLYTTPNAYNQTYSGSTDIFVIKLDGDNGSLLYSTYIGGSNYELPATIEVDSEDNIWICGETGSSDFPTTPNAYNSTMSGVLDMFIFCLSGSNGSLLYSTFVGGSGIEAAYSMDLDSEGNVWATGITDSSDFPMGPSSLYPVYNGSYDAVLFQISKNGTTMLYSTFFGGTDDDRGYKVLVDSSDNIWAAGTTDSFDFPATANAYKNTTSGGRDIYLLKLSTDGSTLIYSTYFGGSSNDDVMSLTFDSFGNIWGTGSTSGTFPTTPNAYDTSYGGSYDCVVFQFAKNGSTLLYSTYLGGSNQDYGRSVLVDRNNVIWISGDTATNTFPTTPDAFNGSYSGIRDAFLLSLAPNGTDLYYSTFLGGSDIEVFASLALSSSGRAWVAGQTYSTNFPTTMDAFNRSASGFSDFFVTSFTIYSAPDSPSNLSAIESVEQNVVLLWEQPEYDGNSEVNSYRVYRNTTSGDFDVILKETIYEYYVDTSVLPDSTYHYVVTAVNSYGESFYSNEVNITMITTIYQPGPPQNLSAAVGDDYIYLNWSAPLDDGGSSVSVYHIYRRAFNEAYSELTSVSNTYFNDTFATEGVLYYYRVTAENTVGEGEVSAEVSAKIPDTTPPSINHPNDISYIEGELGHTISWAPIETNPASFCITRNGTIVILGAWLGNVITLNVDLLPKGTHVFNCTVLDQAGNQASDVVSVIITAAPQPTTTSTTTTTQTSTVLEGGELPTQLLIMVGGGVGIVVVVLLLYRSRR
ncbi:MAG: SBBP repeat-containing protein [Candidatus Thorarchaeota archaeon SMTZ1-45]|nr:MAG: hypothetical protein AM325_15870 [Candidatus Thorarchaeota archaeon SMTZ1-45]